MPSIKLTDFPLVLEVENEYKKCRQEGASREEAENKLKKLYSAELEDGPDDDGLLFWIGLAEGQYQYRELTSDVSKHALTALSAIVDSDWNVSSTEICKKRDQYSCAPMPEKKNIRKANKFRCKWQFGDTYAYQLKGEQAAKCGLSDYYLLLRKVDELPFGDGRVLPVVVLSLCPKNELPTSLEEYCRIPLLRLENGRLGSPKSSFEYRAELIIGSAGALKKLGLMYLGNFANAKIPNDEVIIRESGMTLMLPISCMDTYGCIYKHNHLRFSEP